MYITFYWRNPPVFAFAVAFDAWQHYFSIAWAQQYSWIRLLCCFNPHVLLRNPRRNFKMGGGAYEIRRCSLSCFIIWELFFFCKSPKARKVWPTHPITVHTILFEDFLTKLSRGPGSDWLEWGRLRLSRTSLNNWVPQRRVMSQSGTCSTVGEAGKRHQKNKIKRKSNLPYLLLNWLTYLLQVRQATPERFYRMRQLKFLPRSLQLPCLFFFWAFANTDTDICIMQSCKSHRNDIMTLQLGNVTLFERRLAQESIVAFPTRAFKPGHCVQPSIYGKGWIQRWMKRWIKKDEESPLIEEERWPANLVADRWNVLWHARHVSVLSVWGYLWAFFVKVFA